MNAASTLYVPGRRAASRVTLARRVRRYTKGEAGFWRGQAGAGGSGIRINGGSSGKDGVITLGDHAMVFSELRRVTCGVVVHKAVDNRCDMRITGGILWTRCGQVENSK